MTISSTNKTYMQVMEMLEEIKQEMEVEELDFDDKDSEEQEDYFNEEEPSYSEPDEAQEWYDFDPDC